MAKSSEKGERRAFETQSLEDHRCNFQVSQAENRRQLRDRIVAWEQEHADDPSGAELRLSSWEAVLVRYALEDALELPKARDALLREDKRRRRAESVHRKTPRPSRDRVALRELGIGGKRKHSDAMTKQYLNLLTKEGTVSLGEAPEPEDDLFQRSSESTGLEASTFPAGTLRMLRLPHPSPLSPEEALMVIAEWYGLTPGACQKELQRQRDRRRAAGEHVDYPIPRGE